MSWKVSARPGQRQSRDDLRPRPARHTAPGSGRGAGGRNPRWRNRPDRRPASLTGHRCCRRCTPTARWGRFPPAGYGGGALLLSTSLLAVMSQRLVRRLCPHCRQPRQADADAARQMAVPAGTPLWQPKAAPGVISPAIADAPAFTSCCSLTTASAPPSTAAKMRSP